MQSSHEVTRFKFFSQSAASSPVSISNTQEPISKILASLEPGLRHLTPLLENCSLEDLDDIFSEGQIDQWALGRAISERYTPVDGYSTYGEQLNPWGCDPGYSSLELCLPNYQHERILLMGCSGLRLLSIACHLRKSADEVFMISVDTSLYIHALWQEVCYFMRAHTVDDFEQFPVDLPHQLSDLEPESDFLKAIRSNVRGDRHSALKPYFKRETALNKETLTYLCGLVHFYGYDMVKTLVSSILILPNDWQDERLVELVRNNQAFKQAFSCTKVVTYLSNIVSYSCEQAVYNAKFSNDHHVEFKEARNVLQNLEKLNPDLAIHVDYQKILLTNNCYDDYGTKHVVLIEKDRHGEIEHILNQVWAGEETTELTATGPGLHR